MSKLLIVESPAKAKTIKKYLGDQYKVVASVGHVRDLPKSQLGVDVENDFEPKYISIRGKGDIISALKKEAKNSDIVYLATDPDREGEAISWHLANLLKIPLDSKVRVTFNEITKSAVREGVKKAHPIDDKLVNAQQARRVLDRLVGYQISPFLWKKVKKGLSAGRVQSVATNLIVKREEAIRAFESKEYWTIETDLYKDKKENSFIARFYGKEKKIELLNQEAADTVVSAVTGKSFLVEKVKKGVKSKAPQPAFITSTMQQEASRKLNFQSRRTMKVAQELYEGVDVTGKGLIGLITYMRTDSLRVSNDALSEVRDYIKGTFGEEFCPAAPRVYKAKKLSQDAHEAIRPTSVALEPAKIKKSLTMDQFRLYRLIWERFVASQMENAKYDTVTADITAGGYTFKASGSILKFAGFTALYEESRDETDEESGSKLPEFSEGDNLSLLQCRPEQHFTQPPSRYTEATLIKAMEENGIGRPSTYAPTITTIQQREYIKRDGKTIKPTPLGELTNQVMCEHFSGIVNTEFTANMENDLDKIEEGTSDYLTVMREFYTDFKASLDKAEEEMGDPLVVPEEESDEVCEKCGRRMVVKSGRFGKFLACPGYPDCKNTKAIIIETGAVCPKCGGRVVQKRSKNGNRYYGCEFGPKCDFMTWDEPQKETCPKCGASLFKKGKWGKKFYCGNEACDYGKEPEPEKEKTEGEQAKGE